MRGLPTLKELSARTLRPGLRTPSNRTEGPLARDDAEAAPVLYPRLSSSCSLSRSRSQCSPFSFFPRVLGTASLLLFSRRGACDQQPGTRRGPPPRPGHRRFSFDVPYDSRAPSFAAPRGRSENYPGTIIFHGYRAIHGVRTRTSLDLLPALVAAYCPGSSAR